MALIESYEERISQPVLPDIQIPKLAETEVNTNYVKRYQRFFRKVDKAMLNLFFDLHIVDKSERPLPVPAMIGTYEKAVMYMFGQTSKQDNSGQMRRVRVPCAALIPGDPILDLSRYTYHEAILWDGWGSEQKPFDVRYGRSRGIPINRLYRLNLYTRYHEDMNQLLELVFLKFSPTANLRIGGGFWESIAILENVTANFADEVPNREIRLFRAEVEMTVQTYLPQPLKRAKTVLGISIDTGVGDPRKVGSFHSNDMQKIEAQEGEIPKTWLPNE